jgi:rare lipoprotein A
MRHSEGASARDLRTVPPPAHFVRCAGAAVEVLGGGVRRSRPGILVRCAVSRSPDQLTAAHREIPLGSWVEVTNLTNTRSLTVRVNDRGPFVEGRIIDLSYAAASLLGVTGPGVVPVRVRLAQAPQGAFGPSRFLVQVASFTAESSAQTLKGELERTFRGVHLMKAMVGGEVYYRVRIGSFSSRADAQATAEQLAGLGYRVLIMGAEERL